MTNADPPARLGLWLRCLWNISPPLHLLPLVDAPVRGYLSPHGLHLPTRRPAGARDDDDALWQQAAAAHAAAHLVYSRHRYGIEGLGPIARALLGLLEDARVEWLAARELPGLRALWAAEHAAEPDCAGADVPAPFEALMTRLARCLLDPSHADPHPWVMKGRSLFHLGGDGRLLALHQPADLCRAAALLGDDIGAMRLHFDAPTYAVQPSYRDDNQWLWERPTQAVTPAVEARLIAAPAPRPGGAVSQDPALDVAAGVATGPIRPARGRRA